MKNETTLFFYRKKYLYYKFLVFYLTLYLDLQFYRDERNMMNINKTKDKMDNLLCYVN